MYEKKDTYLRTFVGTAYVIDAQTVGELKKTLEDIAADLPSDGKLRICSVELYNGELRYCLEDGIVNVE
jgi:hypothetical protein